MNNSKGIDTDAFTYQPVKIEMIRPNCPFSFDLFIKVNEKYIHYIRKGDDMDKDRYEKFKMVERLKEKNVERLFITKMDQEQFDTFIDDSIEEAINNNDITEQEKFAIIEDISLNAVELVYTDPESREAFRYVEKAATGLRKVIQKNPKALKNLFKKKDNRDTYLIESHCKNVAALALRLAFIKGVRDQDLDNLGNAALLHDIGLTRLTRHEQNILFTKSPIIMNDQEKDKYELHVDLGLELLKNKPFINKEIIRLVACHEEKNQANGYPNKPKELDLLEEILSLCNCFEKKVTSYNMGPIKAFKDMQVGELGNYNLKLIKKLREILDSEEVFKL